MRLLAILAFLTVVIGVAYFVFSHPGLERLERLEHEARQLAAQNDALANRNRELEEQILALREDPRLAERRARETIGLSRPDELIFQFEPLEERPRRVQVRLRVGPETLELAGRPVEIADLSQALRNLRDELPYGELQILIDDAVGPIERQRILDIVEASPMGEVTPPTGDEENE